jgi:hypothetical protein
MWTDDTDDIDTPALLLVASLAEAASVWGLDRKTIIWAYWRSEVDMRKSGGTWLVSLSDMIERYGPPPFPNAG